MCKTYCRGWRSWFFLILVLPLVLGGCATSTRTYTSTSVVDFLYPNIREPVVAPGIPVLTLPVRVGIVFVPAARKTAPGFALTEKKKTDVLTEVANHFKKYPFVKDIEVIPSAYLTPQGGFTNLDQIRTMYGVDVVALVSYDQTQFTDEGLLSIAYWTIVGAYIVKGQKNDAHTMLDTVVYDVPSRELLFRAPGTSAIKGRSTLVNHSEQLRGDSEEGVKRAAAEMTRNLDEQLVAFREKVKERPEEYRIVRTPGYRGGGMIDSLMLALFTALVGGFLWTRRND